MYFRAILSLLILGIFQPVWAGEIDALIVAYDMGDLNGLKPVADKLNAEGHRVVLVGFGTAGKNLPLSAGDYARQDLLSTNTLQELTKIYKPRVILTGMASALQAQLLNAYAGKAVTIAFYDNCEDPATKDYIQPFMKTIHLKDLSAFYLPAEITRGFFDTFLKTHQGQNTLMVTGNPALAAWDQIFATTDPHDLRQQLDIPIENHVIVFAGGYDETYAQYFKIFVEGVKNLPQTTVLVTYHPKTDGSLERQIVEAANAPTIHIIEGGTFSTSTLCVLADLVACHKSSVGLQALYKGKPVLFVSAPDKHNFLVTQGLAFLADSPTRVQETAARIFATSNTNRPSLALIGLPAHATKRMAEALKQYFVKM